AVLARTSRIGLLVQRTPASALVDGSSRTAAPAPSTKVASWAAAADDSRHSFQLALDLRAAPGRAQRSPFPMTAVLARSSRMGLLVQLTRASALFNGSSRTAAPAPSTKVASWAAAADDSRHSFQLALDLRAAPGRAQRSPFPMTAVLARSSRMGLL